MRIQMDKTFQCETWQEEYNSSRSAPSRTRYLCCQQVWSSIYSFVWLRYQENIFQVGKQAIKKKFNLMPTVPLGMHPSLDLLVMNLYAWTISDIWCCCDLDLTCVDEFQNPMSKSYKHLATPSWGITLTKSSARCMGGPMAKNLDSEEKVDLEQMRFLNTDGYGKYRLRQTGRKFSVVWPCGDLDPVRIASNI